MSTASESEMFLIFTTQLYQYVSVFFLFALFGDLPKYSQTAILYAPHFWRVVNIVLASYSSMQWVAHRRAQIPISKGVG